MKAYNILTVIVTTIVCEERSEMKSFMRSKTAVLILMMLMLLSAGCTGEKSKETVQDSAGGNTTIVTSFYPVYIMTKNICKDIPDVNVTDMTGPTTGCLHDYQLTPDNVKTLEKAQFFVINGAGAESFMDEVIKQQPDLKVIEASRGIKLIKGDGEEGNNPHVWVSIELCIQEVKNIAGQLSELDPAHAAQYQKNSEDYISKLEALKKEMHTALDGLKNRDIITFHEAFPYFAQEFSLNTVAVVEREPGSEPSSAELAKTIQLVKKSGVKALFVEPQYSSRAAETIARETGAGVYTLDPAVTGPDSEDAYLEIMKSNLNTLIEALAK